MEYQVLQNNRAGWQGVWRQLQKTISEHMDDKYIFRVTLNEENDMSNLRYFFPLYSFLRRKNAVCRLFLLGQDDMMYRAKQFLSALLKGEDILVAFGDLAGTQRGQIRAAYLERDKGLTAAEAEIVSYLLTGMTKKDTEDGKSVYSLNCPPGRSKRENGKPLIDGTLLRRVIHDVGSKKARGEKDILIRVETGYPSKASDLLPLLSLSQNAGETDRLLSRFSSLYQTSAYEKLQEVIPSNGKKKQDKGNGADWKNHTQQEDVITQCKENTPSFEGNLLAELIFYFMLRNLCESKRIFCAWSERPMLDISLLQKTALDAKSYAEVLQQAIENAHLHSFGRVAYFGMRIYKADVESSMSDLTKEVNTRHILWKKYWFTDPSVQNKSGGVNSTNANNIFNLSTPDGARVYTDFIEFYVLDDAIGDDGEPLGMLEKIRSDQTTLNDGQRLTRVSDILHLNEADYGQAALNFYIRHYGMRWLHMHAERLNAIVQIYTPHQVKKIHYGQQEYVRQEDLGGFCSSNVFTDGALLSAAQNRAETVLILDQETGDVKSVSSNDKEAALLQKGKTVPGKQLQLLFPAPACYSTEYSILIPLAYGPDPKVQKQVPVKPLLFGGDRAFYRLGDVRTLKLEVREYRSEKEKVQQIYEISRQLSSFLEGEDSRQTLNYISLPGYTSHHIELLAKALFSYIYTMAQGSNPHLLLALDFERNRDLIGEFVRIFSIFYMKQGENEYMKNVQIALCSTSRSSGRKEVNFVLAGSTFRSAYHVANSFVYHNAESSLDFVPLLDYLTPPGDKKDTEQLRICPFDLMLTDAENRCWFWLQMKDKLDTDQRTNQYGCKLSDVHVRLGSKIHIDNFYEAELLFHNVGNVNRFAYLIASDIAQDIPKNPGHIFLVGYENYSAVLLQTVAQMLEDHGCAKKISWVVDSRSSGKFPSVCFDKFTREEQCSWIKKPIRCYTIIPIGSTMSTVHKLMHSFTRGLTAVNGGAEPKVTAGKNYVIVAVGSCYAPGHRLNALEQHYLSEVDQRDCQNSCWRVCVLQKHEADEAALTVHYCLWAETQWHLANPLGDLSDRGEAFARCALTQPLIQVDKTSTLLNAIFQTPLSKNALEYYNRRVLLPSRRHGGGRSAEEENTSECLLRPSSSLHYIRYGHIAQGDNHYQFYFDFENITHSPRIKKELVRWAKKITVDADAYNIVISPLQISNAVFLKTILDCVFGSNLHLLHIDINGTGKETIRTKFEYISEELKQIFSAYSTVHFYYVDDSICTGTTIQRAYKFLYMLCEQAETGLPKLRQSFSNFKFKKVFLLVNRNSYETAQTWVQNPVEDWLGFINLCIPSYNTHANICPACQVRDRFQLLSKRSATNELTKYFSRNAVKHKIRTPAEHDQYLLEEILDNPGYLHWLRVYVCSHETAEDAGVDGETYQNVKEKLLNTPDGENQETIRQLFSDNQEAPCRLMRYAIGQEHFWRLYTMDRAYRKLVYNPELQSLYFQCTAGKNTNPKALDFSSYQIELTKEILKLFCQALSSEDNTYERVMVFTSYLKVISRDYIVRNYFIRKAIYEVLHCILLLMVHLSPEGQYQDLNAFQALVRSLSRGRAEDEFYSIIMDEHYLSLFYTIWDKLRNLDTANGLNVEFLYRIFKIVAHRLALLHSRFIIREAVVNEVLHAYHRLWQQAEPETRKYLPSLDELVKTYIASIKTATMAEDDDGMCHNLLELGE